MVAEGDTNYDLTRPIILPHSLEIDGLLACQPFTRGQNDEGQLYNQSIVLVQRGGDCGFIDKFRNIGPAFAIAVLKINMPRRPRVPAADGPAKCDQRRCTRNPTQFTDHGQEHL